MVAGGGGFGVGGRDGEQDLGDADEDEQHAQAVPGPRGRYRRPVPVAVAVPQQRPRDPAAVLGAPGSRLNAASTTLIRASQPKAAAMTAGAFSSADAMAVVAAPKQGRRRC